MSWWLVLVVSTLLILAYMYLGHRLRGVVQPFRLEVARIGEAMLCDDEMPARVKKSVQFLLDNSFSLRAAITIVVLHPIVWALPAARERVHPIDELEINRQTAVRDLYRKGLLCIVANSPITFTVFLLEVLLFDILLPIRNGVARTVTEAQTAHRWVVRHSGHNPWSWHSR